MAFLTLENISKYYTSGQSVVMGLHNVSLSFSIGEFVAVTGESGSGKSTLARLIAGILPYEAGEMSLDGKPTSHYGQSDWEQYRCSRVSFISQNYDILPGCSVLENVVSALRLINIGRKAAAAKAEKILEQVELWELKNRKAAKLSSGQKQRLSIARALAKPAPILVADEPTGNLDGENSAKIAALLADAAKERLVIMVTHDFDEVRELATRRIVIRDGAVDSDIVLRGEGETAVSGRIQQKEKDKTEGAGGKRKTANLGLYIARLQTKSRPVWSAIMLLFFALTAFSMVAFLGTFVVNLDDSFTRKYDNSVFPNGRDDRLVAAKADKSDMTKEDFRALANIRYVESVERYGYLSDINYYYRENIDYRFHYYAEVDEHGLPTGNMTQTFTLEAPALFLQTVPYLPEGSSFLTAGRYPEHMNEVVAAGDESLLGTEITVYVSNRNLWGADDYIILRTTVVGVTDKGEHLYFSGELGRALTCEYTAKADYLFAPFYDSDVNCPLIVVARPTEGRMFCSEEMFGDCYYSVYTRLLKIDAMTAQAEASTQVYEEPCYFDSYAYPDTSVELKLAGIHDSTYKHYILVEPETFERLTPESCGNVVSLTISDYAYTDRVLTAVSDAGYVVLSPYKIGMTHQDETLAAQRLQTLKICILASLAVFVLQILVLRAMFGMETGEFLLLANLGLRCRTARWSVLWQVAAFTAGGQFLAFLILFWCSRMGVDRIVSVLKYLPASYIVLFMLLHLVTGLLAFVWVLSAVEKQVYPLALRYEDIDLDGEEVQP